MNYESMTKKRKIIYYCALISLLINTVVGYYVHAAITNKSGEDKGYKAIRQFASVLKLIRKNYVDNSKVDYDELIYGALQGMLSSLDRFSSFIPPKDYNLMREETEGEFGGIGVVISIKDNVLTVIAPMEGTPGMRAGIMANDRIIKVEDKETANLTLEQAVGLIKGKPGTQVNLTIFRPSTNETKTFSIERGIIELSTIKDTHFIEQGIGYVRVTQFNEKTIAALEKSIAELNEENLKGLILDLRNNPGGLLSSAIEVSSLFIPHRQLIVFTEGRQDSQKQDFFSSSGTKYLDFPIVIIINEGSASGAEIVAGCLQDYGRALLVGETSFGKGSVQSIIELDDGSAVRLTTAKYYTPSKKVIHEHGVEPDFVVDVTDEESYKLSVQRSRLKNIGHEEANENNVDDLIEDLQLTRSIEVLKGLIIMSHGEKKDYAKIIKSLEKPKQEVKKEIDRE